MVWAQKNVSNGFLSSSATSRLPSIRNLQSVRGTGRGLVNDTDTVTGCPEFAVSGP